jgi:shikimate dehydrogenase
MSSVHEYGIIGLPLTHSRSPQYFNEKFAKEKLKGYSYSAFPLSEIPQLENLLALHPNLYGLNVTSPCKQKVIPYLDELDPVATQVGAVNVIKIERIEGRVKKTGYNSDVSALYRIFKEIQADRFDKALIFGSGGAAKAACYALQQLSLSYAIVSRTPKIGEWHYRDITPALLSEYHLLVNATPLGMSPFEHAMPDIACEGIGKTHFLFDMIYHPEETLFLQEGKRRGATTLNGEKMFLYQAEKSWEIWNSLDEISM